MNIKILSGGAANGLVTALYPAFKAATGFGIEGDYGAVGGMYDRVGAGESVDLIILTERMIFSLKNGGHVVANGLIGLGKVVTGLAVRSGLPIPDIRDGEALRDVLLKADSIYLPDYVKSTAGVHFASVLRKLGIFDLVEKKLKAFPNGQTAMAAMAKSGDKNPIGCTQITEILNTPGVVYAADLPQDYGLSTIYTAAQSSRSLQPDAVQALISLLTANENIEIRKKAGFLV